MLVNHFLPVNQVSRFHNQAHQIADVMRPLIEHLVWILIAREVNNTIQAIDFGFDSFVYNHLAQEIFRFLHFEIEQFRHACQRDFGVVLGHDTNVVLDHTVLQIFPSLAALLSFVVEDSGWWAVLGALFQLGSIQLNEFLLIDQFLKRQSISFRESTKSTRFVLPG